MNRGSKSLRLLDERSVLNLEEKFNTPDIKKLDLRVKNVTLPYNHRTMYWCEPIKLPQWKKHHIIGVYFNFSLSMFANIKSYSMKLFYNQEVKTISTMHKFIHVQKKLLNLLGNPNHVGIRIRPLRIHTAS